MGPWVKDKRGTKKFRNVELKAKDSEKNQILPISHAIYSSNQFHSIYNQITWETMLNLKSKYI